MKIINIESKNSLNLAAETLNQQGILVFPTDTVYGIGCLMDEEAINRLYKIKNRPLSQPTAILLTKETYHSNCWSRENNMDLTNMAENIRGDFLEGKITIVFPVSVFKTEFPKILIKNDKIGIRLPQYPWLEKLIDQVGPIVTASANKRGEAAPARFADIDRDLIEQADLIIKTDKKLSGKPSQVYDLELKKYLR